MKFARETLVRFEHCDPAGIMFFPRFFALVNEAVEDWFAAMAHPFGPLHVTARKGVPTIKLDSEFLRPARVGDRLKQSLLVTHLGRSSCQVRHEAATDSELTARFTQTIVYTDLNTMKSEPWPHGLRTAIAHYVEHT